MHNVTRTSTEFFEHSTVFSSSVNYHETIENNSTMETHNISNDKVHNKKSILKFIMDFGENKIQNVKLKEQIKFKEPFKLKDAVISCNNVTTFNGHLRVVYWPRNETLAT
jgi:hypothetical protein